MPSTVIKAFRYNPDSRVLRVWFVAGGVYDYFEVPDAVARDFVTARSKGRYFADLIRDRYEFERVTRAGPIGPPGARP